MFRFVGGALLIAAFQLLCLGHAAAQEEGTGSDSHVNQQDPGDMEERDSGQVEEHELGASASETDGEGSGLETSSPIEDSTPDGEHDASSESDDPAQEGQSSMTITDGTSGEGEDNPPPTPDAEEAEPQGEQEAPPDSGGGADATNPANTVSFIRIIPEYQRLATENGDTNSWGLRIQPKLGFSSRGFMLLEIPAYWADNDDVASRTSLFGMGDLRIQAFGLPYLASSQEATVLSVGVSLDLFMPTGSVDAGLGSGRWNVAPGMLIGLHLVGPLLMFGIVAYSASIPGNPASTEDVIHSLKVTLFIVLKLPRSFYVQVIPDFLQNLNGERSTFFSTEFIFGWQWGSTLAIDMRYRREFVSDVGGIDRAGVSVTLFF